MQFAGKLFQKLTPMYDERSDHHVVAFARLLVRNSEVMIMSELSLKTYVSLKTDQS